MFALRRAYALALVCSAAITTPVHAQVRSSDGPDTHGFFFSLSGAAGVFRADSITTHSERGIGTTLGVGYGVTPNLALVFDGTTEFYRRGQIDKYGIDVLDLGVRLQLPRAGASGVPYADVMVGGVILRKDSVAAADVPVGKSLASQTDIDCTCLTVGAGWLGFVTSMLAIDVNVHWSSGDLKAMAPGAIGRPSLSLPTRSLRVNLGLSLFSGPSRGAR